MPKNRNKGHKTKPTLQNSIHKHYSDANYKQKIPQESRKQKHESQYPKNIKLPVACPVPRDLGVVHEKKSLER